MIAFELPEPRFEELTLLNADPVRGQASESAEALGGRVAVGGPHGFKLAADQVAADPELGRFLDRAAGRHEYYLVHLGVSFPPAGAPRLQSAEVRLRLTSVPGTPEPFALALYPLAAGYQVKVGSKLRVLPSVKVADQVELSLGDYERDASYERSEHFLTGLGLDGPNPGWAFTRTNAGEIAGSYRLTMVIQAGYGSAVAVGGTVTARVRGNIPWRFERELPRPLNFEAVV